MKQVRLLIFHLYSFLSNDHICDKDNDMKNNMKELPVSTFMPHHSTSHRHIKEGKRAHNV